MRRGLSIFLVLFFGLGPLTATLQASDESRLPPCCRRHGAHHCAMYDAMVAQMVQAESGSTPVLSAPSHCPYYPGNSTAATASFHALAPSQAGLPALLAQAHSPAGSRAAARLHRIRTHAGRGPPHPTLG